MHAHAAASRGQPVSPYVSPVILTLGFSLGIPSEKSERGPYAARGRTEWLGRLDMIHTRPGNTEIHTRHATAGTQPRTSRRRAHGRRRSTRAPRAGDRGALRAAWEPDKAEGTLLRSSKRRRRGFSGAHRARKTPRAPASRRRGGGLPGPHIARSRAQTHGCRRGGRARACGNIPFQGKEHACSVPTGSSSYL